MNSQHTAAFIAANSSYSAVSINIALRVLRRALRLAVEWGKLTAAPKFPMTPGENHRERVLTEDEFHRYLSACRPMWRDVVVLLYGTAARPSEAYGLRWEQVLLNGTGGLIQFTEGKTKQARRLLPMMPTVYSMLVARHRDQGAPTEGFVFPSDGVSGHLVEQRAFQLHRAALRESGLTSFCLYTLRHSALTRLAESGCDAFTLARIAGHSSISITQRYCHPQAEAIDRAFANLSQKVVTNGGYQLSEDVLNSAKYAGSRG